MAVVQEIDRMEALLKAQEIAELILASEEMKSYLKSKEDLRNDERAQEQIRQFQRLKEKYEETQRFGKYHPDYETISEQVRQARSELHRLPTVKAFKKAESALEELLYQVCRITADGVSPTIKVPSDNPLLNLGGGCGAAGGCGSGGACGCAN